MSKKYVRLGTDGYYFRPEIVLDPGECEWTGEPVIDVIEYGPTMGNAALPADVKAARWASARGLPYRG